MGLYYKEPSKSFQATTSYHYEVKKIYI